ncbi:conserved domain protein [Methanothrix soehngenii GP6]|uniref:Conserved domain protein n=1 Tax=Methanothrix soehngenii (strain ATCC 5969 / DSM 3671 / JCM 10134 / NBRC 103675 / OCM 69 / GP-6) TaxID=990316 RepID=F4BVM7_METSG|nr:conserved domain protein [Methanothrix soehngenii GP6]
MINSCFNSLFIGIGSAIRGLVKGMVEPGNSFNSLFIGIGSAMKDLFEGLLPRFSFQFPFHRDRLCNAAQTGFTSSNSWTCFNSLFIGIGSAIR